MLMTHLPSHPLTGPAPRHLGSERCLAGLAVTAAIFRLWLRRHRTRRELAELDDHILRDIGVSWADAERERARPFWQPWPWRST